ncbi:TOBE domain-containing protein [Sulfurimonas sp.]|uniref:TOBE domain-containing protein n=1 Tax=Sulfurimonas sp. TaxID=2022749 RepID=UPI003D10A30E
MSHFVAKIVEIESLQSLHLVKLSRDEQYFSMISLELNENVQVGTEVKLYVKSSNIVLSKNSNKELSIANQFKTIITSIKYGTILTNIKLDFLGNCLEALLTTHQAKQLQLQEGDKVYAFINESDLSLVPMDN